MITAQVRFLAAQIGMVLVRVAARANWLTSPVAPFQVAETTNGKAKLER